MMMFRYKLAQLIFSHLQCNNITRSAADDEDMWWRKKRLMCDGQVEKAIGQVLKVTSSRQAGLL